MWWDGQRRRADRERDIKRKGALKIQTVRWRQTQTMVKEKKRKSFVKLLSSSISSKFKEESHEQWWRSLVLICCIQTSHSKLVILYALSSSLTKGHIVQDFMSSSFETARRSVYYSVTFLFLCELHFHSNPQYPLFILIFRCIHEKDMKRNRNSLSKV